MKKKIFLFIPSFKNGGSERVTIIFAKQLISRGYNVRLVVVSGYNDELSSYIPSYMNVLFLNSKRALFSLPKIYLLILRNKPDYIMSSLEHVSIPLVLANIICNSRAKIVLRHGYSVDRIVKNSLSYFIAKYIYSKCDLLISQTEEMKSDLIKVFKIKDTNKCISLMNPIDYEFLNEKIKDPSPFPENTTNFVAIGSVSKIKGFDLLVKAFEVVIRENINRHLYIVGKISDMTLVDEANKLSYSSHIHFVGFNENPYKYLKNCDYFVLSSRSEGLPNALLEALYLNKPIIATRCTPFVERTIKSGIDGIVVDVDSIEDLGSAMLEIQNMKISKNRIPYVPKINSFVDIIENL